MKFLGKNTYAEAAEFIEAQFLSQNQLKTKQIYAHKTVATDTDNVKVVFWAVKDVIMNAFLEKMGLGLNGGGNGQLEGVM
jgi:guanine nucleotide-binding protein G(o) subunit alpha